MTVTVSAPGMTLVELPGLVGGGLMTSGFSAQLGASLHGGVTVRITSSNPNVLLVSPNTTTAGTPFVDIPVANGSTDASFAIHGVEGAQGTVTLTATAPGFPTRRARRRCATSGCSCKVWRRRRRRCRRMIRSRSRVGVLNTAGSFGSEQALRVGAPSLTVTVSHTNTAVGQLVTTSGSRSVADRDHCGRAVDVPDQWPPAGWRSTRLAAARRRSLPRRRVSRLLLA